LLKDRILVLFENYAEDTRQVIAEVLELEQRHISMERPRVKEEIRKIVDRAVKDEA
jgi:hypothetical protein